MIAVTAKFRTMVSMVVTREVDNTSSPGEEVRLGDKDIMTALAVGEGVLEMRHFKMPQAGPALCRQCPICHHSIQTIPWLQF
jgi:hypothetical protein